MNIKKFQGKTEKEAIEKAKDELGNEAIVMNVKSIQPKGFGRIFKKPVFEVTAAVDDKTIFREPEEPKVPVKKKAMNSQSTLDLYADEPSVPDMTEYNPYEELQRTEVRQETPKVYSSPAKLLHHKSAMENASPLEAVTPVDSMLSFGTKSPASATIEQKLNNLQDLLEKQIENTNVKDQQEEEAVNKNVTFLQLIYNQMINNEVNEVYANQIISEVEAGFNRETAVDNILASVYQRIILKLGQSKPIQVEKGKTKVVFFIGPTGVGKTTTIAKLASAFKMNENLKIALLTSDTYRIAAVEQLRTYGNILGLPLKVVYTSDEMSGILKEYKDYDLILVDTAGRSHKSSDQCREIKELIQKVPQNETYLVLSATTKYRDLMKITEAYEDISEYKIIFTKLDETNSFGNILNVKMLTGAELAYATWGQSVPDDIGEFDAQMIAKHVLGGDQ